MSQDQLINFITQSRAAGKSDDAIKHELLTAGWQESLVSAAFSPTVPTPTSSLPSGSEVTIGYAGFWHRVAASVVDGIIVSFGFTLLSIPIVILLPEEIASALLLPLAIAVTLWYYPYMEAKKGYTFGKQFIGLRVKRDGTNQNLTLKRSVGRFFARFLSAMTFGIGFLMAAFTEKKQALHDIVVGSVVLSTPRVNSYRTALSIILGIFGPVLRMIFVVPLIMGVLLAGLFSGFASGIDSDFEYGFEPSQFESISSESLYEPTSGPVALTAEELDSFISSTNINAIIDLDPQTFAAGYTQTGPATITWDSSWNDEVVLYLPVYQGVSLADYATVAISEVIDSTGSNVYDPSDDFGSIIDFYELGYEVDGVQYEMVEISRDFGSFETFDPMQRVSGTLILTIPLEAGGEYSRSFDFTLELQ